jgi:uncharacterized coiled-coil protein SlyX
MKEERDKGAVRAIPISDTRISSVDAPKTKNAKSKDGKSKDERRRVAQLQQLENRIAALESELAVLAAALENPPDDAAAVARLGQEYERLQRQMDGMLKEWEQVQA